VLALQARRAINPAAFSRASHEFKACQLDMRLHLQSLNDLVCPACSDGLAAVHVDGNMKLYNWDRNREPWRKPHYTKFFLQEQAVKCTLDALDLATHNQVGAHCSSLWTDAAACTAHHTCCLHNSSYFMLRVLQQCCRSAHPDHAIKCF
jgi:hypothetical protein